MDGFVDFVFSAWGAATAGASIAWRWLKRNWTSGVAWLALLVLSFRLVRTLRKTLKLATTPHQRAFVVLGLHAAFLKAATKVIEEPTTSRQTRLAIQAADGIVTPWVDEYVAANEGVTAKQAS